MLRIATWSLSAALHGTLLLSFVNLGGGAALESGAGDDMMRIEQGIALEGFARIGDAQESVDAVEAEQVQLSQAQPEIKEVEAKDEAKPEDAPPEVKASELPEDTEVVTSKDGPEQEVIKPKKLEEAEQPRPPQVATLEQNQEIAVEEKRASGPEQSGGDTTVQSAYLGKLRSHLERFKVNPRSRTRGTVIVKFTLNASGEVIAREVATSSGSKVLDDAAMAALDRASPFPPFPQRASQEPLVVSVPFKFITR